MRSTTRAQWQAAFDRLATGDVAGAVADVSTFATVNDRARFLAAAAKLTRLPAVGEPATYHIGTDRYSGRVEWVSPTGHQCRVVLTSGRSDIFTRRQRRIVMPSWAWGAKAHVSIYRPKGANYAWVTFGVAEDYRDPTR